MANEFGLYTLENGLPVPTTDHDAWGKWFMDPARRHVAETVVGTRRVSTVFMGIGHGFTADGNVILWETLTWEPDGEPGERENYSSERAARIGHDHAVAVARLMVS